METTPPQSERQSMETVTITEAAQRLGVSERTIYRMLRSGRLRRVHLSDRKSTSVRLLSDSLDRIEIDSRNNSSVVTSLMSDNQSDISDVKAMDTLMKELEQKDAQIARLIDSQQEMAQTLRQLQEQMFELARLVLSQQSVALKPAAESEAPVKRESRDGLPGPLARLFRVRDKKSDHSR